MSNGTGSNNQWTSTQAYVLAIICLVVGVGAGYVLRGSRPASTPTQATTPTGQMGQMPGGMGEGGQMPSPEQMKRMADKQAEPLLARLKNEPKNAELLAQIGNIYYDTRNFQEAINYYKQSVAIAPNPNVNTDMATSYWFLGDADTAIREFENSLKLDPKHANTYLNLGIVKWEGKMDTDGAVAAWEKLLQVAPNFPERDTVNQLIARAKAHQNIQPGTKTDKPAR